ncbi:type II toxin-antitoxin system PrlF family antitoxin [Limosilactobacillus reuteri]|uniref:type II toxin-antitoxin system PrlF family antitoxin n=1 Tax=Limosilactobacillus reuteri TaxID=1598 RepID=UPI001E345C2A|nr:type II toxin-antitoxin system PrlF family antitoxin [Limosilactobacillus reuteri]MCC4509357.1 type II toxin-antitoxin system PrlF family antitoxin [Limosilactobacillus reuteri]
MMMERVTSSTITSKNQTTVPKMIRQTLQLGPGDEIRYIIDGNGNVHIIKAKKDATNMWKKAYAQEKKYGSINTDEPDWGTDIESEELD